MSHRQVRAESINALLIRGQKNRVAELTQCCMTPNHSLYETRPSETRIFPGGTIPEEGPATVASEYEASVSSTILVNRCNSRWWGCMDARSSVSSSVIGVRVVCTDCRCVKAATSPTGSYWSCACVKRFSSSEIMASVEEDT